MTIDSQEPTLSVVIPAFNEAGRISVAIHDIAATLSSIHGEAWELIVVDDGSTDKTVDVVRSLSAIVPSLRLISHVGNLGKGAAVRTGVLAANGKTILFADADGATPFREYLRLRNALEPDVQIVVGSRRDDSDSTVRRSRRRAIMGGLFRGLVRLLLNPSVSDSQCGFKLFRREIARRLFMQSLETGYLFDLEILGLAERQNVPILEVSVDWHEVPGSKIRVFRDSWRMFLGLLRIRRRISNGCAMEVKPSGIGDSMSRSLAVTIDV